jgi:hypothetical protein
LIVPYLLAWITVGLSTIFRGRAAWAILLLLIAVTSAGSLVYYRAIPPVREYREIAQAMKERFAQDDLIFVRARDWATTPCFYHLQGEFHRLVAAHFAETLKRSPQSRVWLLICGDRLPLSHEAVESLAGYKFVEEVNSFRCRALLFAPQHSN